MTKPLFDFTTKRDFHAELIVISPLHVGSGMDVKEPELQVETDGGQVNAEVAEIVRDGHGKPYIPGSTLKGALRARLAALTDEEMAEKLFGKAGDDSSIMSALVVYGAEFSSAPKDCTLPRYESSHGTFISARTAIDGGRGTVVQHKLFHARQVAPGATFKFHVTLFEIGDKDNEQLCTLLLKDMAESGLRLGRGGADAAGRLKVSNPSASESNMNLESGVLTNRSVSGGWSFPTLDADVKQRLGAKPACKPDVFTFTAYDDPFFVNDWHWSSKGEMKKRKDEARKAANDPKARSDKAQLQALRRKADEPELTGESLMGVLRSRATWLAAREKARATGEQRSPAYDENHVSILFGSQDRKAHLTLRALDFEKAGPAIRVASVRLDRLAHGPMDSALFDAEPFTGCAYKAVFDYLPRPNGKSCQDEGKLKEALFEDLEKNGLILGHAGNRGFGWFKAVKDSAP